MTSDQWLRCGNDVELGGQAVVQARHQSSLVPAPLAGKDKSGTAARLADGAISVAEGSTCWARR